MKMFKIYLTLCGFLVLIGKAAADEDNLNIFNKFQQNDFKIKYERTEVVSYNKHIAKQFEMHTFKYNRTQAVTNATIEFKIDVDSDLEVIVQTYKFMSNEYRYFPIRLQVNFCFAISKNLLGVGEFTRCGNFRGCPLLKGRVIRICNWSVNESKLPPLIPSGRYMIEFQFLHHNIEVVLLQGYGEVYRPFVF